MSLTNLPVLSMSHPRTANGGYIWYSRLPQLMAHEPVSQPAVLEPEQKQESDWLFWFGAAAVVAAVGALVVYAVSSGKSDSATAAIPEPSVAPPNDEWVVFKRGELLAMDIHLSCEGVNLWDMLEMSNGEIEAQLVACLEECVGSGVEFMVVLENGSIQARVVAKVKKGWRSLVRIDVNKVRRKMSSVIEMYGKKVGKVIRSPEVQLTLKVVQYTASVAASIAVVLDFFGIPGAAELSNAINHWAHANGGIA